MRRARARRPRSGAPRPSQAGSRTEGVPPPIALQERPRSWRALRTEGVPPSIGSLESACLQEFAVLFHGSQQFSRTEWCACKEQALLRATSIAQGNGAVRRARARRPRSGAPRPSQAGSRTEGVPPSIGALATTCHQQVWKSFHGWKVGLRFMRAISFAGRSRARAGNKRFAPSIAPSECASNHETRNLSHRTEQASSRRESERPRSKAFRPRVEATLFRSSLRP